MIAGDLKARIGNLGETVTQESSNSNDRMVINEGRKLKDKIFKNDLWILNRANTEDKERRIHTIR